MRDFDELFTALSRSRFRSRIKLREREQAYLRRKGMRAVLDEAAGIITQRLALAEPLNDGKQTPMRNHPVFVAQHATGTCCRGCLAKWHRLAKGVVLTGEQQAYVVRVIAYWLEIQAAPDVSASGEQPTLFR
jgi:Domain of unknown function (DUF4186)